MNGLQRPPSHPPALPGVDRTTRNPARKVAARHSPILHESDRARTRRFVHEGNRCWARGAGIERRGRPPSPTFRVEGGGLASHSAQRCMKKEAALRRPLREKSRRRPTLPPRLQGSTIGAGGLNFWVRNGTRCGPSAMATGNLLTCQVLLSAQGTLNTPERARAKSSPRPISTGRLNTLLCVQLRPINLVV